MIGKRYIDGDKLMGQLDRYAPKLLDSIKTRMRDWLRRQPHAPELVSRQGAAELLGLQSAHLARLGDRLPDPIEVTSGHRVYLKAEVEALAAELRAEKKAKS